MKKRQKIELSGYRSLIFDFDGVILDSNDIKRAAIAAAVTDVLEPQRAVEFVTYFIRYNGVPRRDKVAKFIPAKYVEKVLKRYEVQLENDLFDAPLINGVRGFIQLVISSCETASSLFVLSGGEAREVSRLLQHNGLEGFFERVYAAPYRKEENLKRMDLQYPALFFGDSLVDLDAARAAGLDFVFVYGASNVVDWKSKIDQSNTIAIIKDFQIEAAVC